MIAIVQMLYCVLLTIIYCILFGTIFASLVARAAPTAMPFFKSSPTYTIGLVIILGYFFFRKKL